MLKAKQLACIEAMLASPAMSVTALASLVGVNRNTVSDWRRNNEEFKAEYQRRLREKWKDSEGIAVDTMRNLASEGDFKASKYILDSLGYAPDQNINVKGEQSVSITILGDDEIDDTEEISEVD